MLTQAPKGTKDTLPMNIEKWQSVEKKFHEVCRAFGFSEIRTPMIEHTELFARGVGDTSDIVQKQMYTFEDYGGRSITLRPEGTAGVARAFIENKLYADVLPAKLWYEVSCFRYEKPQSGRLREFHQFGIECFGATDMVADAEVIALADTFLKSLSTPSLELHINSIGCPTCRPIYKEALKAFLKPKYDALCDTCKSRYETNPLRILDCKSPVCQELTQGAPHMLDYLCDECADAFDSLQKNLEAYGVAYKVDPGIVRGLDYYTKTAFEFVTNAIGAQGTVCGGGRYDNLIEELGGPAVPGVGFGLGIERLLLLLETVGADAERTHDTDVLFVVMGEAAKRKALSLLPLLRAEGLSAETDIVGRSLKNQFKHADRIGAKYAAVIGDEELTSETITLKDLITGEQTKTAMDGFAKYIQRKVTGQEV
ncbi:MAG: histidine--tRNA ligase [Clostridiales Family XIII bacterium]|jgi:histidyl-tRNA synthetase|nr:histidine--tRNA ligase [Clostridiales Family XIII bacterium]